MRTRVKICGITRPEDAGEAARLGVDAIGLVFHPDSPRAVDLRRAAEIVRSLPPFVTVVGLFVDPPQGRVEAVLAALSLDLLQFHGRETAARCRGFGRPYIKALTAGTGSDIAARAAEYPDAAGILLDAEVDGRSGGTGRTFDWRRVPEGLNRPLILAGGLGPENVAEAIRAVHPYAVDVSSGVESAKGIKDAARMAAFVRGVHSVDAGKDPVHPR